MLLSCNLRKLFHSQILRRDYTEGLENDEIYSENSYSIFIFFLYLKRQLKYMIIDS